MASKASSEPATRDFQEGDAEKVHALIQDLASARGRFESNLVLRKSFSEHFPAYVKAATAGGKGVVRIAEAEGAICGVAIAVETVRDPWLPAEKCAELRAIYVDPDHRRSGVAATLIDDVVAWARKRGLDVVSVHTFADHPEEAEALEALGFRPYRMQLERKVEPA